MAVFMPEVVFEGDVHWWKVWATFIAEHGLAAAYTSPDLNYQPGLLYVLKIYEWLCGGKIETSIVLLKQLFFVFDVAAVMIAGFLLIRFQQSPYWSWLILLNPGFLYNTFYGDSAIVYICCFVFSLYSALYSTNLIWPSAFFLQHCSPNHKPSLWDPYCSCSIGRGGKRNPYVG